MPARFEKRVVTLEFHSEAGMLFDRPLSWFGQVGDPGDEGCGVSPSFSVATPAPIDPPRLLESTVYARASAASNRSDLVQSLFKASLAASRPGSGVGVSAAFSRWRWAFSISPRSR